MRRAALAALIAAPAETRRLLAECLRLASILDRGDASPGGADPASAAAPPSSSFVPPLETHGAALVDDVLAALESAPPDPSAPLAPNLLLAAHVAATPFQYFRDPAAAAAAPAPALERLCASFATPVLLPALQRAARRSSRDACAAREARLGFKILHRLVRAYAPGGARPALGSVSAAAAAACEGFGEPAGNAADPESWVAASAREARGGARDAPRRAARPRVPRTLVGAARRVAARPTRRRRRRRRRSLALGAVRGRARGTRATRGVGRRWTPSRPSTRARRPGTRNARINRAWLRSRR